MSFFSQFELSHFSGIFKNVCKTPPTVLKFYRHLDHALKIACGWDIRPQIIFCHFFCNLNLVIFRTFSHLESDVPVGGIHYENLPMQYTDNFFSCRKFKFQQKNHDIFLIFAQNIDCGYKLEPPR